MTVDVPPHRPTDAETKATADLDLPSDDTYATGVLRAAGEAMSRRDYDRAIRVLKGLALVRPEDGRIYEGFGAVYLALGRKGDAEACYRVAHDIDSASLRANLHLGEIAVQRGDDAVARKHLEVVVSTGDSRLASRAQRALGKL